MVYQAVKPKTILKKQERHGIPSRTVAAALDCSDTLWSLFLSGQKGLSYAMQSEVCDLFEFFDELAGCSTVPIDFRQADRICELWEQHKAKLAKSGCIQSARELERAEAGERKTRVAVSGEDAAG